MVHALDVVGFPAAPIAVVLAEAVLDQVVHRATALERALAEL